jgi:hypothetical protein
MGATFLLLVLAQRLAEGFGHDVSNGGFAQHTLHAGRGGIESAVQRTEVHRMVRMTDRALGDPSRRLDCRDDRQQRELVRGDREAKAPIEPALRSDDAAAPQRLEHFGEVAGGDSGAVGDLLGGHRGTAGLRRQAQHRS